MGRRQAHTRQRARRGITQRLDWPTVAPLRKEQVQGGPSAIRLLMPRRPLEEVEQRLQLQRLWRPQPVDTPLPLQGNAGPDPLSSVRIGVCRGAESSASVSNIAVCGSDQVVTGGWTHLRGP